MISHIPVMTLRIAAGLFVMVASVALAPAAEDPSTLRLDRQSLANRRFEFSWSSNGGHGVNGVATLCADGRIAGIASPNETRWSVDATGCLVFEHADGRTSTRYDRAWQEDGWLELEGPFLFRTGITHHLSEINSESRERVHQIRPDQADRILYSRQQFVYLDPGETCSIPVRDHGNRTLRLVSVHEEMDSVIGLARRATVKIEIDDQPLELECAPYTLPVESAGLRIQADTTSAWLDMPKRVQFSVWDGADPVVDTDRFQFPLPGYQLFSHGMQAYNEPVHLGHRDGDPSGQRFYHNYGVDLAGFEGRQKVVSCIDGTVARVDRVQGSLAIQDAQGFIVDFNHLDSILTAMEPGVHVRRGQWVGMLGRRGASGNFSHLHVGTFLSSAALKRGGHNTNLNLYPWLIAAYLREQSPPLLAVAQPHATALTGERIHFDAGHSIAPAGRITSYRWEFHDGTTAEEPVAEKVYDQPGCYMATLRIEDDQGHRDVDFCRVRVYSRDAPEQVMPTLFVTFTPTTHVRVDEPVFFRAWPQGRAVEDLQIDFGDDTNWSDYEPETPIPHRFAKPGLYVVKFTGVVKSTGRAGSLSVSQYVKVVVGP